MPAFEYRRVSGNLLHELAEKVISGESLVLLGSSNGGKSYVLDRLQDILEKRPECSPKPLKLQLRYEMPVTNRVAFAKVVAKEVARAWNVKPGPVPTTNAFFDTLFQTGDTAKSSATILISNVDSLPHHFLNLFLAEVSGRIKARTFKGVFSGGNGLLNVILQGNTHLSDFRFYVLQGFELEEFGTVARRFADAMHLEIESPAATIQSLFYQTGGDIYLLKLILWALVERRAVLGPWVDEPVVPGEIPDLFSSTGIPFSFGANAFNDASRLIAQNPDCWEDLCNLILKKPVTVISSNSVPSRLEIVGVAVREDGSLRFASDLISFNKKPFRRSETG